MDFIKILLYFSSLSFLIYGVLCFCSPAMRVEFERYGLAKFRVLTGILELLGGLGLLVGLYSLPILLISSAGLGLLMLAGTTVRIRIRDSFLSSLPAVFYMLLNFFIFWSYFASSSSKF